MKLFVLFTVIFSFGLSASAQGTSSTSSVKKRVSQRKAVTRASRSRLVRSNRSSGWRAKPIAGFSVFGLTGVDQDSEFEQTGLVGLSAGALVEYKTPGIWGFESGLLAVRAGDSFEFDGSKGVEGTIDISTWYFHIPAMAKAYAIQESDVEVYFKGGLVLGILLDSEANSDLKVVSGASSTAVNTVEDLDDVFNTLDMLGKAGIGINWAFSSGASFNLDLAVSMSFFDIVDGANSQTVRNLGFTSLVGVQFAL